MSRSTSHGKSKVDYEPHKLGSEGSNPSRANTPSLGIVFLEDLVECRLGHHLFFLLFCILIFEGDKYEKRTNV